MPYRAFVEPLEYFKLQLPIPRPGDPEKHREVKQPELNELLRKTADEDPAAWHFHAVDHEEGPALVFKTPVDGITTGGTHYPRTELAAVDENRFSIFDGRHEMRVKCAVNRMPRGKPCVCISQVKGNASHHSEACKLLAVERNSSAPDFWLEAHVKSPDGNGGLKEDTLRIGKFAYGQPFEYKLVTNNGHFLAECFTSGEKQGHNYNFGVYQERRQQCKENPHDDLYAFKLGSYCNCNAEQADDPKDYSEVCFFGWSISSSPNHQLPPEMEEDLARVAEQA